MADYGVLPTGFSRKPLSTILTEIEESLVTEFGPGVVQTPQSPLGQINGLMADLIAQLWEYAEDVYHSFDIDQAEGVRLDALARLRLLRRAEGEQDDAFRQAITNQGRARIDVSDITRALVGLKGVTYCQVFVNDGSQTAIDAMPPGALCVSILGGDDEEIATTLRRYVAAGVQTFGNTIVSATIDGFCRAMSILRPALVPVKLTIDVLLRADTFGCPPPSLLTVRDGFLQDMTGARRLLNGENLNHFKIRSAIEGRYPNVEVVSFIGERDGIEGMPGQPVEISFFEIATLAETDVVVRLAQVDGGAD